MPYPYNNGYQISPEQRKGLLIGSMLAGGLGYGAGRARGNDNLSSIVQGLGSGVMGYGGGIMGLQEYQSKVLGDVLNQKQMDLQTEKEAYMKPYYESMGDYYKSMGSAKEMPRQLPEQEKYNWIQTLPEGNIRDDMMERVMPKQESSTNVNVNTGLMEKEEQKYIGKALGENYQKIQDEAGIGRNELDMFGTLKELSTQTDTGKLEPFKTQLAGYAQALGMPINSRYNANQMFEAISNRLTVMARKVGEGQILAGQISDSDREFLKRSVPELAKLPEANKMLIDWNMKLAQRKIEIAKLAEEYYDANGTMRGFNDARSAWVKENPLFENLPLINKQGGFTTPDTNQPQATDPFSKYWK